MAFASSECAQRLPDGIPCGNRLLASLTQLLPECAQRLLNPTPSGSAGRARPRMRHPSRREANAEMGFLHKTCFQGTRQLTRKDNAFWSSYLLRQNRLRHHALSNSWLGDISTTPSRAGRLCMNLKSSPGSQARLTHGQTSLAWNPSLRQSSKFSFDYSLLPPRSALGDAPRRPAAQASSPPPTPTYSQERNSCNHG